jgi:hypothetical protein
MKRWPPLASLALLSLGAACAEDAAPPNAEGAGAAAPTAVITGHDTASLAPGETIDLAYRENAVYEFRPEGAPVDFARVVLRSPDGGARTMAEALAESAQVTGEGAAFFAENAFRITTSRRPSDGARTDGRARPPGLETQRPGLCGYYECVEGSCGCVHCYYIPYICEVP